MEDANIPKIPVQPISYRDATPILEQLSDAFTLPDGALLHGE